MSEHSSQIHSLNHNSSKGSGYEEAHVGNCGIGDDASVEGEGVKNAKFSRTNGCSNAVGRRERPLRACTQRAAARLQAAADAEVNVGEGERERKRVKRKERLAARLLKDDSDLDVGEEVQELEEEEHEVRQEIVEADGSTSLVRLQRSKIITPLVGEPEASQLPRWKIRSMWQLASILNFLNVFRPFLNIKVEFSAEELETALITPNKTLADVHMPLLKAIPPITRMALGHATWVTVLCRKLRDWWHWVAEGDLPIVASHGTEFEFYNNLDPGVRVVILKALCDIRVEQEDIRNYIDDSLKRGAKMSAFRKERIGGDSHGISYWYEEDPIVGHRLYREIRKFEPRKGKGKSLPPIPSSSYQWETVATNLEEFENVSEKLFTSESRTEAAVGKKLKNDMLSEIMRVHKRKEKLLKKQHRQALMLDNMMYLDNFTAGRSLRDRKPVRYTFDDYDRSINEALKVPKKRPPSPNAFYSGDPTVNFEPFTNGEWTGPSDYNETPFFVSSPKSPDGDELYDDQQAEMLDRGNRQRRRPQRYSVNEFVGAVTDDVDFDSDEDIVGEAVYDDEYLRKRKERRKMSSSSEGDEEYNLEEEETHEEEEEEDDINLSSSEDSDVRHSFKSSMGRTRRETKLRSVGDLQPGLRRSKRATRNRINYKQYELSESDTELMKRKKAYTQDAHTTESDGAESSRDSEYSNEKINLHTMDPNQITGNQPEAPDTRHNDSIPLHRTVPAKELTDQEDFDGIKGRRFIDLNELAPGSGFDENSSMLSDDNRDDL